MRLLRQLTFLNTTPSNRTERDNRETVNRTTTEPQRRPGPGPPGPGQSRSVRLGCSGWVEEDGRAFSRTMSSMSSIFHPLPSITRAIKAGFVTRVRPTGDGPYED